MKKIGLMSMVVAALMVMGSWAFAADTIKVGCAFSLTGDYAGSGDNYFKGVEMAVEELNAGGGLLGKQLEIVMFDNQDFAPEVVMQGADYLMDQKKVAVVVAGWAGAGADVRAYGKYDVPVFLDDGSQASVDVYKEDPEKYRNTYFMTPVAAAQGSSVFNVLQALPYDYPNKKVVLINTDDAWGGEIGAVQAKRFKEIGWEVALHEIVPYGTNEWGPILTKVRRIKPAVIHFEIAASQEPITFVRQFLKRPTNTIISLGWSITPLEVVETLGKKADGVMGDMPAGMPVPQAPTAEAQAWLDKYEKRYKHDLGVGSFVTYTSFMAWAEAAKASGDAYNFKAVNKHLSSVAYKGLMGDIKWGEDNTLHPQPGAPMVHYQVQNGELVTLYTDPPVTPYKDNKFIKPSWIK
jgi:ABC-type branched-subunit amino acid transport system substrate-binding protein